ncbi:hypothetical protein N9263_01405 [Candidatus Marinimicrobia bacterium]|nr:hypothetical protein [Candidatus Neomarinimicrobiota bacterium]
MKILLGLLSLAMCFPNQQVFVACEGNFNSANGSLWTIVDQEVYQYPDNPLGDVVQSVLVHGNQLFIIVNASSNIQVFDITNDGLTPTHIIDTNYSGPREMLVYNNYLYFTNWYSADIKKLNLSTWEIDAEIPMPGLPEDIIMHNGRLYASITMNYDWSDGNLVTEINLETDSIIQSHDVGTGPGQLLEYEGDIYVSRTYYDSNWNTFYGTSRIGANEIDIISYGAGTPCGGGIYKYQNSIYRSFNGGIAKLDINMNIQADTRIGSYEQNSVYSTEIIGDYIYFGLSDYNAPDDIKVVDVNGIEIATFQVGAIPGDFAVWNDCLNDGDVNIDGVLNILDIVQIVDLILSNAEYTCSADSNSDGIVNILDVVQLVQSIIGIESFQGAVNWIQRHFPEMKVNYHIKEALAPIRTIQPNK